MHTTDDQLDSGLALSRARRPWYARLISTGALVFYCLLAGWLAVALLAVGRYDLGLGFAALGSLLTLVSLVRGRTVAARQKESLSRALMGASRRNRELERLRELAATLLAGSDLASLNRQVADSAADLLEAEGGAIML
ncbi:MAG TPA: hypothetical protein PLL69_12095, partial [Gemmatimonadales bacterium]|nr:hypothetical protein [Gemmatimonadales bacterium]